MSQEPSQPAEAQTLLGSPPAVATSAHPVSTLRDFFESVPPGQKVALTSEDFKQVGTSANGRVFRLNCPSIVMHCDDSQCKGPRLHEFEGNSLESIRSTDEFISYLCRNCKQRRKVFAVSWRIAGDVHTVEKYGERPHFGPPTPARLTAMIGNERDHFFKGRRCESQSLGIAAFAYYRRVVENRKDAIIDEITRVSEKLSAEPDLLRELAEARKQVQFTAAVDTVRHALPDSLMINGHNPLTLLHAALSEGLHAKSDVECLQLAADIRVVLTELVERAANAMKEEAELSGAVARLLKIRRDRAARDE